MEQTLQNTKAKERRRSQRRAVLQAARLEFAGMILPCEIRDYCAAGLHLVFPAGDMQHAVAPLERGVPLRVEFAVGTGAGDRRFRLEGRAAHVTSTSAGVYVENFPEPALRALGEVAGHAQSGGEGDAADLGPGKKRALRQECTRLFSSFLDTLLQDFFALAPGKLTEAGQEASSLDQSRYHFGALELEQHRTRIQNDFFSAIRERLQSEGRTPGADAFTTAVEELELELVDESEFEDWLNLSSVSGRLEADFDEQLAYFEKRYSLLIDQTLQRKDNPFGPEAICTALRDALRSQDFTNAMRLIVYRAFGQVLTGHLPELYERLGKVLVLIQPGKTKKRAMPRPSKGVQGDEAAQPVPELPSPEPPSLPSPGEEGTIPAPPAPQRPTPDKQARYEDIEYSLDRILASLEQHQAGSGKAGQAEAASDKTPAEKAAVPAGRAGGQGLAQLTAALQQTSRRIAHAGGAAAAVPAQPEAGLPEASVHELLAAVESLSMGQLTESGGERAALIDQVNARLALAAGGVRRIAPAYQQALDEAAKLFGRARAEHPPASEVDSLLKRLERPLLKLALKDPEFLATTDHPARGVVNRLDQYAIAADDQGKFFDPKLYRFLSLLVDRICSQSEEDPGVFAVARDRLEKVLQPIRQARRNRVFRHQEACEGRDSIRGARGRVGEFLEARLAAREVPVLLLRVLDAGWRQYLVLLAMRRGESGQAWQQAADVLERLMARLMPDRKPEGGDRQAGQALLEEVVRGLAEVNIAFDELADLREALARVLVSGEAAEGAVILVPPGRFAAVPVEQQDVPQQHEQLISQLRIGDWWDISTDGRWAPMQLIWMGEAAASCAFANRSATQRLDLALQELAQRSEEGSVRLNRDQAVPLLDRSEYALFDESYRHLLQQVLHDPVTGLVNRKGFMQRLHAAMAAGRAEQRHSLCLLEFDQSRVIYSSCGAEAGDALLRNLCAEIQAQLRPDDLLAAFNSDTFALFLPDCSGDAGRAMADKLLHSLKDHRFQHGKDIFSVGLNIGLTEFSPALGSGADALRQANSACLTAKSLGRNRMQVYEATDTQLQNQESMLEWAGRIDSILEQKGLFLRGQMVMPIGSDVSLLPYYEILLGIRDAGGDVKPMHFVPAVERWKRSHEIDLWVMREVFAWIRLNRAFFDQIGGFSVNLSALSLSNPEVLAYLHEELGREDTPTEKITFEITETTAIDSYVTAQDFMRQVRSYGCKFSLDDFGSGFASYSHLKNLRTDSLKIDGSFVKEIAHSPADYAMVKSMNEIGHSLGMKTVAEYVESPVILSKLREIGVDYAQGYAIHKPVPIAELIEPASA